MKRIAILVLLVFVTATAAQSGHSVQLNWTASSSTVTGYNVYRLAGTCPVSVSLATFTKLTTAPTAALTYTDSTVTAGSTYCYAATSVAAGGESPANGTLQVTIPLFTAAAIPAPPGAFGSSAVQ